MGNDGNGNTSNCSFTIILIDTISPMITCPSAQTLPLNAQCQATILNYTDNAITSDNCEAEIDIVLSQTPVAGTVLTGHNTTQNITLIATDNSGNSSQCTFQVQVEDQSPPSLTCPTNQMVDLDNNCTTNIEDYTSSIVADDNCVATSAITISQTPVAGTTLNGVGTTQLINIVGNDGNGNTSNCSFSITLIDTISPMITCPSAQILPLNAQCQATIIDYTDNAITSDNCEAEIDIVLSQTPVAGTVLTGHNTTQNITLIATDNSGNSSQCTFQVQVEDQSPPSLTCPTNQNVVTGNGCNINILDYTEDVETIDNCTEMSSIALSQTPIAGTILNDVGTTQLITIIGDDGNGNTSECSFTITLIDALNPIITCPDLETLSLNESCQATISDYTNKLILSDNCEVKMDITLSQSPVAGTILTGHNTSETVTITATDNSGNSNQCTFQVIAKDQSPPNFTCPDNQDVRLNKDCSTNIFDYTDRISSIDNCTPMSNISIHQTPAAGTVLNGTGTQLVNIVVDDGNGNTSECFFNITLTDPKVCLPVNVVVKRNGR